MCTSEHLHFCSFRAGISLCSNGKALPYDFGATQTQLVGRHGPTQAATRTRCDTFICTPAFCTKLTRLQNRYIFQSHVVIIFYRFLQAPNVNAICPL